MTARGRTLGHMKRLVATASALGAASACDKTEGTTSVVSTTAPSSTTTSPLSTATATAPASTTATIKPILPPTGYAVVDPMPMPARCMGTAAASKATATYVKQGADLVLKISVKLGDGATWTGSEIGSTFGGKLLNVTTNGTKTTVDVFMPAAPSAGVSIPVRCGALTGSLFVDATPPPNPKAGDTATTSLYDR